MNAGQVRRAARAVLITAGVLGFLGVLAVIFAVAGRTIGGAP